MAVQCGSYLSWSKTPKAGFVVTLHHLSLGKTGSFIVSIFPFLMSSFKNRGRQAIRFMDLIKDKTSEKINGCKSRPRINEFCLVSINVDFLDIHNSIGLAIVFCAASVKL